MEQLAVVLHKYVGLRCMSSNSQRMHAAMGDGSSVRFLMGE
jgi:hypothetical protein